jgi:uncharacterized membrane protein YfcA
MAVEWLLTYLALGSVVGFFAGLFGIGGGGIMVPVLTTVFALQGMPPALIVHAALATSLAAIITTSISSLRAHHQLGAVNWPIVRGITPGILLGSFSATFIAAYLSSLFLAIFFVLFMSYVALQMLLNIKPRPGRKLPGTFGLTFAGLVIGAISSLVAIGGGTMTVPFLTWCNVKIQTAIGTSAAVGLPIAIAGTLGYFISGLNTSGMPAWSMGFVYLPAVLLISLMSAISAPLGAKLAHRLPVVALKKLFAGLLLLLALKMLHTVLSS